MGNTHYHRDLRLCGNTRAIHVKGSLRLTRCVLPLLMARSAPSLWSNDKYFFTISTNAFLVCICLYMCVCVCVASRLPQAFEIRKACLGVNHPDTVATLAGAIVQLINSSMTRSQLAKAEPMCSLAVKCSMAMKQQADLG
jgi:hypothetical protein